MTADAAVAALGRSRGAHAATLLGAYKVERVRAQQRVLARPACSTSGGEEPTLVCDHEGAHRSFALEGGGAAVRRITVLTAIILSLPASALGASGSGTPVAASTVAAAGAGLHVLPTTLASSAGLLGTPPLAVDAVGAAAAVAGSTPTWVAATRAAGVVGAVAYAGWGYWQGYELIADEFFREFPVPDVANTGWAGRESHNPTAPSYAFSCVPSSSCYRWNFPEEHSFFNLRTVHPARLINSFGMAFATARTEQSRAQAMVASGSQPLRTSGNIATRYQWETAARMAA